MNYKVKVFFPFSVGTLFIVFLSIFTVTTIQNTYIDSTISSKAEEIEKIFYSQIDRDAKTINGLIEILKDDVELQFLYVDKEREKFFEEARPAYEKLAKHYQISSLKFFDTEGKLFLNSVNKKDLKQPESFILNEALKYQRSFYGIEKESSGELFLKVVYPWYIARDFVGFIEIAKELKNISIDLKEVVEAEFLIASRKNEKFVIDSLTLNELSDVQKRKVLNYTKGLHKLSIKNKIFFVNSLDLIDAQEQDVARIFILNDFTEEVSYMYTLIFFSSTLILAVSVIALFTYYRYLSKINRKLVRSRKKLEKVSITDELTKLYNRRYFNDFFPKEIQKCARSECDITLLMIDVDNFKKYNDTYGHQEGDAVLKQVARAIKNSVKRATDTTFRLGGEEFAVIVANSNFQEGKAVGEKIRKAIEDLKIPHSSNNASAYVTASIGVITNYATPDLTTNEMYKDADIALYKAKKSGRNRVVA